MEIEIIESGKPETNPMEKVTEWIGVYPVHPLASAYPICTTRDFYESVSCGIIKPIEFDQHGRIVDGRSRLANHLKLIEDRAMMYDKKPDDFPRVTVVLETYDDVLQHILNANNNRRHQSEDQRVAITAKLYLMASEHNEWEKAQKAKKEAALQKKGEPNNNPTGKNQHSRPVNTESYSLATEEKPKRDTKEMNARSTVGKIASESKTTHHKAGQAVKVAKAAPEALEKVVSGEMKLREAAKVAEKSAPKKEKKERKKQEKKAEVGLPEKRERVIIRDGDLDYFLKWLDAAPIHMVQQVADKCESIL
jgi:hypothetical protein